jgi:pimeloyl-ACP methyl ester carboxylesterase
MQTDTGFSDFTYSAHDGLKLHARVYGKPRQGRLPVICLAGLTRNARDFHALALKLSQDPKAPRQVVAFDYRGRGESERDGNWENYNVQVEARDVLDGLVALGIDAAAFIGTSRGGVIIHVLAALRPTVLKAAVLNDVGPVIEGAGLAQIRAYLERAPKPKTFAEAVALAKSAQGQVFFALSDADWERMVRAIHRDEKGMPVPDFDRALLKTLGRIDFNKPLPSLWPQFEAMAAIPLMVVRGAYSALLSETTVEEMARRHPGMEAITVDGQGHAPLLETGTLPARIADFLTLAERGVRTS